MAKKKAKKKAAVTTKAKTGVDKCGRREGTQGFLINSKINGKPQTIAQLCKATKLPKGRVTTHLWDMTRKGFTKKNKQGEYSWA